MNEKLKLTALHSRIAQLCNSGALSGRMVMRLMDFQVKDELDWFLKQHGVYLDYSSADLERDAETHRRLFGGDEVLCQEVAHRIQPYLDEMAKAAGGDGLGPVALKVEGQPHERERFVNPRAWASSRVMIAYVDYLPSHTLTLDEAKAYLAALEAGKRGKHWEVCR